MLHCDALLDIGSNCVLLISKSMFARNEVNVEMAVDRSFILVFSDNLLFHIKHNSDNHNNVQKRVVYSLRENWSNSQSELLGRRKTGRIWAFAKNGKGGSSYEKNVW